MSNEERRIHTDGSNEQLVGHIQQRFTAEDVNDEMTEVLKITAASISSQYHSIYHIWVESRTYVCFHENREGVLSVFGENGDYDAALDYYIKNYIVPEDQAAMREFTNLSAVKERLRDHRTISRVYRQNDIGWTRGTFLVGKRDEAGNVTNVIYSAANINAEVELKEKQKQAVYEAEHDALTGIYNRKGLEAVLASEDLKNSKVGFAVFDIDNFKLINDNFGHIIGDQILIAVSAQLASVFFTEDIIARIGGDEFAILLRDCDTSAWDKICQKLRTVHASLAGIFQKGLDLSVTLSTGLAFSETGFDRQLYQLADEGLYHTKRFGRAGCTMIGPDHRILNRWHDETLSMLSQNVLEFNNTGVCQIEIPDDPQKPRRLICGDVEKSLMGIPNTATSEECYALWRDRIDPDYRETLFRAEQSMIECGQTECTFSWKHPEHGRIFMRCGGFGEKKKGKTVLSGYCHTLTNTRIVEKESDYAQVLRALNDTFVSSFYIDFKNGTVSAFKLGPEVDYIDKQTADIPTLLTDFIYTVVDPRDRALMQDFSDIKTLQERLRTERFLDAEYRSMVMGTWCRVMLIPVRYDEAGTPTHVLLTITALDSGKLKEVYTLDYDRRSLAALFDHLPCGAVMYEWNGGTLESVHISKYYKEHSGHMFVQTGTRDNLELNFRSIHPNDAEACHKAIMHALKESHVLHQEYRVWDEDANSYVWERVDAVISPSERNTQLIYAVYTDITQRKEQEIHLEKSHASLLAALHASNQLCYEYDPINHTIECMTAKNFLGLPDLVENFPDSVKECTLLHIEDMDTFIETVNRIDNGEKQAHCDVRLRKDGDFCWYSCSFNKYYDAARERNIAILTITDISFRMATLKMYEDRLRSLTSIAENTLCMTLVNLTQKNYEVLDCKPSVRAFVNTALPLKEFVLYPADSIVGEKKQEEYRKLFSTEYLLQQAAEGNMHVQMEYLLKESETHYEWILSAIDMIQNPITKEITGTLYSKSQQISKMNQMLLNSALEHVYLFAAVIFVDTDEFYLYNYQKGKYSQCMQNYWDHARQGISKQYAEEIQRDLEEIFVKENVLRELEQNEEYHYAYDGIINQKFQRLELHFCYADAEHTMLLASMRNITDERLLKKYRHESEHDELTGLYNRRTMFFKCRELLLEHPEDTFAMVHFDIKYFRLYNTFYGDEAGDELLCYIAGVFNQMDQGNSSCVYGRIEADVFAVFLPYGLLKAYEECLPKRLDALRRYHAEFQIEPVIGVYLVTNREMPIESMFTRASLAAKMVQPGASDTTIFFNEDMEKTLKENQEMLNELENAVQQEQFRVYLQPKYELETNKPIGAEALVRWIHPVKGMIPPDHFIPLFESNGSIAVLDRYMLERACQLLSSWKEAGLPMIPISVNVSRISAYSRDTVTFLKELVKKYDIETKYLELELTESAYVESPEEIRLRLADLQEYGFKILMDDFGSGYSSLNSLKSLPLDILKLDMKFLSSADDERGKSILSSVVRMSKLLNLPVIAEGIETEQQAAYLRSIGCEYVQGYLYARPMTISDYEHMICNKKEE